MLRYILISLALLSILSCSSDDDTQVDSVINQNFYALKVGNSWVYKYYDFNSATNTYTDSGIIDSVSVDGITSLNGIDYYQYTIKTSGVPAGRESFYDSRNGSTTLLRRDDNGRLTNDYDYHYFINNDFTEFHVESTPFGGGTNTFEFYQQLTSVNDTVSTNAGQFTCHKSDFYVKPDNGQRSPGNSLIYYAEGVGEVKFVCTWIASPDIVYEKRLESYSLVP